MSDEEQWGVFVTGMDSGVYTIHVADSAELQKTTVTRFRQLVHKKWSEVSTDAESLRMLFAGKQLENKLPSGREATLGDYNIMRNSTVQLVFRVPGGQPTRNRNRHGTATEPEPESKATGKLTERVPKPPVVEKVHDVFDLSLKFTTKEPDVIIGFSFEDDQPRVKMSCGHAVDANSLTAWCRTLIDQQAFQFHCPAIVDQAKNTQCKKVWPYEEVRRVALLNEAEQKYFESKMSEYAALQFCNMKECPGCRSFLERHDLDNLRVHCPICTKRKKRNYDFCWQCSSEWTGPTTSSVKCGKTNCQHPDLPAIRDAPIVTINEKQVPNRRACPTCGRVVEHNLEGCKFIICQCCKNEFCFLCLELKEACLKTAPNSWLGACSKDPAKQQTVIPVWSQQK